MEKEENILHYNSEEVELKQPIVVEKSSYEWKGDGKILITLKKQNAPSFWKFLLKDVEREAKELQVWWEMRDKYIE